MDDWPIRTIPDDFWDSLPPALSRPCLGDAFQIVRNRIVAALRPYGTVGPLEEFELSTQRYLGNVEEPDFFVVDDNLHGQPVVRVEVEGGRIEPGTLAALRDAVREAEAVAVLAFGDCGLVATPHGLFLGGERLERCKAFAEIVASLP